MNYQALAVEIVSGPRAGDCEKHVHTNGMQKISGKEVVLKDQAIADILNEPTDERVIEFNVNARTLLSKLGAVVASTILDKLEAAAEQLSPVKWAMRFLTSAEGINLGDPQTLGMLDQLQAGDVLTHDEVAALKALVTVSSSRAIAVVGQAVTAADVSIAIRGGNDWRGI